MVRIRDRVRLTIWLVSHALFGEWPEFRREVIETGTEDGWRICQPGKVWLAFGTQ